MRQDPAARPPARRWQFDRVEFDEAGSSLSVDGQFIEVEPKPLQVLRTLLEQAGKVVTKDVLIQAAWPGRIITDAALAKAIARLREAIGDKDQTLVKTHHGYGYRLVARVVVGDAEGTVSRAAPFESRDGPQAERPRADSTSGESRNTADSLRGTQKLADAEHRPLTVLFCDLVDSTQLAESLDPETFRELLLDYRRIAADICTRYEGHVAQQFGDGLLIYFGYPAAHDDDAERAARCACDLLATLRRPNGDSQLSARIGIHSGSVLIGRTGQGGEILATGAGVHLAARLQTLAEPDTILCSEATFRLVPGLFVTRAFGPQTLRGLSEDVCVHQVLRPSGVRSRLDAATALTPFVGRELERSLLRECWDDAINGNGQAILVSGEPGLGKSRLLLELRARLAGSAHTWLECRADALNRHSAYQPLIELLQRGLALQEGDSDTLRLERLERGLDAAGLDKTNTVPLLALLLALPLPPAYAPSQLAPALKRQRTLAALADWVLRLAHAQPLVIAFEDLHWADESSLDFLRVLLPRLADSPILLLMTARTEFTSSWPADASVQRLSLDPLPTPDVEQMLGSLCGGRALSPALRRLIFERAGGVPLFVEELTHSLLDSGQLVERGGQLEAVLPIQQLAIPGSLQGLLMARLDRLGTARELIQIAAVVGREIPHDLLARVSGLAQTELRRQLRQLGEAGLLHALGSRPIQTYVFKHALIRDSAYETLVKKRRQALHGLIAQTLEAHFAERANLWPEVLATHFDLAALFEPAVRWYHRAADKAVAGNHDAEVLRYCGRALELLGKLDDDDLRRRRELELLVLLAAAKIAVLGRGHPDVDTILVRCQALCAQLDDEELSARTLANLALTRVGVGDYRGYGEVGERFLALARRSGRKVYEGTGHALVSQALYYGAELERSADHAERALGVFDEQVSREAIALNGLDGRSFVMGMNAYCLWFMGYPERAIRRADEALSRAELSAHPQSISLERSRRAWNFLLRRDPEKALDAAEGAADYAGQHGFEGWQDFALQQTGFALCMLGRFEQGHSLLQAMKAKRRERRAYWAEVLNCGLEAQLCLDAGRPVEAGLALDEAFDALVRFGERFYEPELHRIRGLLLLARDANNLAAAEACFRRALDIARSQQSRSLELRAATSLARLWLQQARRPEALALLGAVYGGFTEGFDTPDLQDAVALLAELA